MFQVKAETWKKAPELFNRNEATLNEDVNTIKKWISTQPHLPEIMEDAKIRNFLLLNKCSIERTKQKIDMYYTIRTLIPDLYQDTNPKLSHMKELMEIIYCFPFPKQIDNMYRVYFTRMNNYSTFLPREITMQFNNIGEIRLYEDCMLGDIFIFDMYMVSLGDITKITPTLVVKVFASYEVSEDDKLIKDILPIEDLPKDYGGEGPMLKELNEMMKAKLNEYQERFDRLDKLRVDESLRPEKLCNDEVLGFYGNFKKLAVD